jgi:flagellar basal-body rod protein FlgB
MRQLRNNVTSANIANAETPGYQAKKVEFEGALANALRLESAAGVTHSDPNHLAIAGEGSIGRVRADVFDNPEGPVTNDGNNVDMEKEMATLAENSILYRAAIQLINKKLASMKYAASDGGR